MTMSDYYEQKYKTMLHSKTLSGGELKTTSEAISACWDGSIPGSGYVPLPPYICPRCNKTIDLADKEQVAFHNSQRCMIKSKFMLRKEDEDKLQNLVDAKLSQIKKLEEAEFRKKFIAELSEKAAQMEKEAISEWIVKTNGIDLQKRLELSRSIRNTCEYISKNNDSSNDKV
jgi:hypothetical protein